MTVDISQLVRSSGIDVERTATTLFGNAVEDFSKSTINPALNSLFGVNTTSSPSRNDGSWHSTDYASAIANTSFRPKMKFLFKVEFLFHDTVLTKFGQQTAEWQRNFVFNIKTVDRPKVDFDYEEVNQYNFRTKVLKQIKHREITMAFYDDVGNSVHEFFRFMMMAYSPITRRSAATNSFNIADVHAEQVGNGMLFDMNPVSALDMAHRGVIDTPVGNAIKAIKVSQFFTDPSSPDIDHAPKEVAYFFINPRIVSFDLEDVSHDANEPNAFTMSFDYDNMVMTGIRVMVPDPDKSKQLPPYKDSPGDASPTGRIQADGSTSGTSAGGGNTNPYLSIISGAVGTAVSKITNDTIGRKLRQIPGGQSAAGTLSSLVGGLSKNTINGTVGIFGAGNTANATNQATARPAKDVVIDSSTAGSDDATFVSSTGTIA